MSHESAVHLNAGETIIKTIHRHWFVLLTRTLALLFALFAPLAIIIAVASLDLHIGDQPLTISLNPALVTFAMSAWAIFIWMQFFHFWTDHYLDGWIVTNKRIIDVEQRGFFSRQVSSFRIERIQDVTSDVHGFIATLLDFGDIHVQTAGDDQEFVLTHAPKPKAIKELILKESDRMIEFERTDYTNHPTGSSL